MEQDKATMGYLVGRPTPPCIGQRGTTSATSPICGSGQETHSQAHPTIGFKSVQDQRLKMFITWIVGPTIPMLVLKWTKGFIPTLYYTSRGPTPKGEGPLISGGSPDALPHRPTLPYGSTASPSDSMQGNTNASHPKCWFEAV